MRLTGGEFRGRVVEVPKSGALRPTQDRVREALFNILAPEIPGSDFLDLFAGSGAVGLEAASRGAASVAFVEKDSRHLDAIKRNIAALVGRVAPDAPPLGRARCADACAPYGFRFAKSTLRFASLICGASQRAVPCDAIRANAYRWVERYAGPGFTVAFADPPYALGEERGYAGFLATLAERGVVRPGGVFVAEMTAVQKSEETPGWELVRDRTYGKTRLAIWRRR